MQIVPEPGVIFPCMGNILGVILFLRGPWSLGTDWHRYVYSLGICGPMYRIMMHSDALWWIMMDYVVF